MQSTVGNSFNELICINWYNGCCIKYVAYKDAVQLKII